MPIKALLFVFLVSIHFCSYAQISISSIYGRSLYSKGDFRGNSFQIGLQKKLKDHFEASVMIGNFQFSKNDEYLYQSVINGPFDQTAQFRHLVLINHLDVGFNYFIIDKKIKVAIGGGASVAQTISNSPQEYRIDFPLLTGMPNPTYQIYYPEKFKKTNLGPTANLSVLYAISKNIDLGIALSYRQFDDILVWSLPISFKYKLSQ